MMITVYRATVEGGRETRRYKTLAGARAYAQRYLGEHPDVGTSYATDPYGVATIAVDGATLADLFPAAASNEPFPLDEEYGPSDHAPWRLSHGRWGTYEQYQSDPGCDGNPYLGGSCGDPSHTYEEALPHMSAEQIAEQKAYEREELRRSLEQAHAALAQMRDDDHGLPF